MASPKGALFEAKGSFFFYSQALFIQQTGLEDPDIFLIHIVYTNKSIQLYTHVYMYICIYVYMYICIYVFFYEMIWGSTVRWLFLPNILEDDIPVRRVFSKWINKNHLGAKGQSHIWLLQNTLFFPRGSNKNSLKLLVQDKHCQGKGCPLRTKNQIHCNKWALEYLVAWCI